jgi:hypothetical protein
VIVAGSERPKTSIGIKHDPFPYYAHMQKNVKEDIFRETEGTLNPAF